MTNFPWRPKVKARLCAASRHGRQRGFTLIELLVSFAVLALMVAVLATTFSNFVGVTSSSGKRLETNNQMRTIFDRMSFDLASSIRRGGVTIAFNKNAQASGGAAGLNDSMVFLTDARTSSPSRMARIAYEVNMDNNPVLKTDFSSLFRGVEPFSWQDNAGSTALRSTADWQPLGRGIFRMELSFLKTDGTLASTQPPENETAAVICSVASLDENSFSKLSQSERSFLVAALPDAIDNELPISRWTADRFSALPLFVRQNVRFSQRQFYLK